MREEGVPNKLCAQGNLFEERKRKKEEGGWEEKREFAPRQTQTQTTLLEVLLRERRRKNGNWLQLLLMFKEMSSKSFGGLDMG